MLGTRILRELIGLALLVFGTVSATNFRDFPAGLARTSFEMMPPRFRLDSGEARVRF